ncbi:uncharacterized protein PV07_09503 [Cladophialophora immunda]|uniref:TLC domain-containing protein n=1 Tax=Cladophialophora immunda TaxID=569365 RepID=A0A0D1ZF35_9EURO|nr:uncharacterized protein PV07_09503 [Cladophialophora immunda]KIW26406.1 hypothetical protein PV07_09503 [Cladophialophora immunda]OQV05446.1 hypothetical protein CLAIMM_10186 [Cladophialophora immunda]
MPLLSSTLLLRTHSLTLLTCAYYLLTSPTQLLSSTPIWLLGESMSVRPAGYAPESIPHGAGPSGSAGAGGSRTSMPMRGPLISGPGQGQGAVVAQSERELFALLGLVVSVYAVTQFLFAGDLSVVQGTAATTASSSSMGTRASGARRLDSSFAAAAAAAKSPSRYAEELHTLLTAQSRWLTLSAIHVLASSALVFWIYMFHSHGASEPVSSTASAESWTSLLSGLNLLANRVVFTIGLADMLFWGYLWTVLKEEGREVAKVLARRREAEDDE